MNERAASPAPRRGLPWSWRGVILAVVLAQFVLVHGAGRMFDWDAAILWTYATIPALVLAALALRREVAFVPWFIHTIEIAAAKFWITATLLLVLLVIHGNSRGIDPTPFPRPALSALPSEPGAASTEPDVAAAIVFETGAHEIRPAFAAVRSGQRVGVRSVDVALHSAHLQRRDGTSVVNLAVRSSGRPAVFVVDEPGGLFTLDCAVHGASEPSARLLVLP